MFQIFVWSLGGAVPIGPSPIETGDLDVICSRARVQDVGSLSDKWDSIWSSPYTVGTGRTSNFPEIRLVNTSDKRGLQKFSWISSAVWPVRESFNPGRSPISDCAETFDSRGWKRACKQSPAEFPGLGRTWSWDLYQFQGPYWLPSWNCIELHFAFLKLQDYNPKNWQMDVDGLVLQRPRHRHE